MSCSKDRYNEINNRIKIMRGEMRDLQHDLQGEGLKILRDVVIDESSSYESQLCDLIGIYITIYGNQPDYIVVDRFVYVDLLGKEITEIEGSKILCRTRGIVC